MVDGRHAESTRRRQRVLTALDRTMAEGSKIGVSAIARAAGVDRSFLSCHRDLLAQIHAADAEPPSTYGYISPSATRTSPPPAPPTVN